MTNLDFTFDKYRELCREIAASDFILLTVHEYLSNKNPDNCIILRHDVDRKPLQALKMAKIEHEYDIRSTYYFRTINEVYNIPIIKQIENLGHEIGYHYEVLDKTKGDVKKAIIIFEKELKEFRKQFEITTICMHGNPLTPWVNRDIWKEYNFADFGIIGEVYLSLDYKKILYLSDTNRSWNSFRYSIKDHVHYNPINIGINSTDEIIGLINSGKVDKMCILTHPNRWSSNISEWLKEYIIQNMKNVGKIGINFYRKRWH